MSISGVSSTPTSPNTLPASDSKGSGNDDLLGQAEKIAREGFLLSLQAKQITNKYAAAKEVR